MTISYASCCTVQLFHDFFPEKIFTDFKLSPTSQTQELFQQYDLKIRHHHNQFSIFYNSERYNESEPAAFPDLQFLLYFPDPYFYNFTDIPIDSQPGLYSFQNRMGNTLLSKQAFVSLADYDTEAPPVADHVFGMLTLSLQVPSAETPSPTYALAFAARKTVWRYYLINASQTIGENLSITPTSESIGEFYDAGMTELPNGQSARIFHTDLASPIPLQQQYGAMAKLSSGSQVVMDQMPNPSPQSLSKSQAGDQMQYFSDIYVYI